MSAGVSVAVQGAIPSVTEDNRARASGPDRQKGGAREARLRSLLGDKWHTLLYYSLVVVVIAYGWTRRGDVYLSPEEGIGYALGITGGTMMALLLLYPVRKHVRWMRNFGKVRHWFRAHMIMGIIGPVLVLYHCNFQLGSLNGTIALFSMLLVASSGLLGRYFYTRIHYGLYGKKADLANLGSDATVIRSFMHRVFAAAPDLQDKLTRLEKMTLRQPHSLPGGAVHILHIAFVSRWCGLLAKARMHKIQEAIITRDGLNAGEIRKLRQSSEYYLRLYMETIRRVAGFTFYERLFALWHVLHLPLFIMMLVAGVIHVYAVHFY